MIFIYKHDNELFYIDEERIGRLECGHYFPSLNIENNNCSISFEHHSYKGMTTILSENEIDRLKQYNKDIDNLGYSIEEDDERYKKGVELSKGIEDILEKLKSEKATELYQKLLKSDWEDFARCNYISDKDIVELVECIEESNTIADRSVIGCIYDNVYELGQDVLDYAQCDDFLQDFINWEEVGESLIDDNYYRYCRLEDGRIIEMMI